HSPGGDAEHRGDSLLQYRRLGGELHCPRRGNGWNTRAVADRGARPPGDGPAGGADVMRDEGPAEATTEEAAPFEYGRIAELYNAWFRVSGSKRGVEQFLERVDWRLPARPRVLDAGAGTGVLGLWFLARFPESEVVAFDIDRQ